MTRFVPFSRRYGNASGAPRDMRDVTANAGRYHRVGAPPTGETGVCAQFAAPLHNEPAQGPPSGPAGEARLIAMALQIAATTT